MRRIVIVSDNPYLSRAVSLSLAGLGAEVCCVASRGEWLRICERGAVDLLIVLRAAGFLAREREVERLRRAVGNPRLYILTWHHSERIVLALLEQGADQCMTFPVNLARLRRKVAEELTGVYE